MKCWAEMVHHGVVIMDTIASQITSLTIVYSTVYSGADQRKPQSSASLAFVRGIHWWPVNSQHKWPVTRKIIPFDDVIMMNRAPHDQNFHLPNLQNVAFSNTHYLKDKFAKIHLSHWQFYLPWVIGQSDMSALNELLLRKLSKSNHQHDQMTNLHKQNWNLV